MYLFFKRKDSRTTVQPTPPVAVIRVVLLHKQGNRVILYFLKCIFNLFITYIVIHKELAL